MKEKIKKFLLRLLYWIPSKLPSGVPQFEAFANSLIYAYELPDNDSFRWLIASLLQHFDRTKDLAVLKLLFGQAFAAKRRFYLEIRGAEVRQTAGSMFVMIKEKQMAEMEARKASEAAAAQSTPTEVPKGTPTLSVVPNGQPEKAPS